MGWRMFNDDRRRGPDLDLDPGHGHGRDRPSPADRASVVDPRPTNGCWLSSSARVLRGAHGGRCQPPCSDSRSVPQLRGADGRRAQRAADNRRLRVHAVLRLLRESRPVPARQSPTFQKIT